MNFNLSSIISLLTVLLVIIVSHANGYEPVCSEFKILKRRNSRNFGGNISKKCSHAFYSASGSIHVQCNFRGNIAGDNNCINGGLKVVNTIYCKQFDITVNSHFLNIVAWVKPGLKLKYSCTVQRVGQESPELCKCGRRNTNRITQGVETGVNEFPSMAVLMENNSQKCGATIISNRYVLTAAHCVDNGQPQDFQIVVGEHNLATGSETNSTKIHTVKAIKTHSATFNGNDIALLELNEPINFNDNVGPICLPFGNRDDTFVGKTVTAVGWGFLDYTGPQTQLLHKTSLEVIDPARCNLSKIICTLGMHTDACEHDSGGPLFYECPNTKRLIQIGIIVAGSACGSNIPGINTNVMDYLSWIQSTTGETFCETTCN